MTVRLFGEAGIGKTTMCGVAVEHAARRNMTVWRATSAPHAGTHPYGVLSELRSPDGTRLVPTPLAEQAGTGPQIVTASHGAEVERFAVGERVIEAVEEHCQTPTLIVIEDLHWADPASLDGIGRIAQSALTHPLVLILTHRTGRLTGGLSSLVGVLTAQSAEAFEVPRLSASEMRMLVDELTSGSASEALHDRVAGAAGNPFLARELIDGLLAEGRLDLGADSASVVDGRVPEQLRRAVAAELERLGIGVTQLVRAASLHGAIIDVRDLAAQLGQTTAMLSTTLDAAVRSGLLVEVDEGVGFRHDLVRSAVYQDMTPVVRAGTHRDLAEVLAARDASPALVASHLLMAGGDDPVTVERLQRAASQTAPLDPDTALSFLDRARDLAESDPATRRVIEHARLEALTAMGRIAEAEAVAHWLIETVPDADLAEIHGRLGGLALIAGNHSRAGRHFEQAIELARQDWRRCSYIGAAAVTAATARDYARAWQLAEQAVELGEEIDSPIGTSIGMALLARMSTYANQVETGLSMGAQAVAVADRDPTGEAHAWIPALHYGMTAFDVDRLAVAEEMVARGVQMAETHRMAWALPLYGTLQAACHLRRGDLDRAAAEAETAVEQSELMHSHHTIGWAQAILAMVATDVSSAVEARAWVERAHATWERMRSSLGADLVALASARVLQAEGRHQAAFDELCARWDDFSDQGLDFCHPMLAVDLALLSRRFDRPDRFDASVAALVGAADKNEVPAIGAMGEWLAAIGAGNRAAACTALDRLRRSERRLDVARLLAAEPALSAPDGDPVTALSEALERFESTGATRRADETRAAIEALGVRPRASAHDWDLLTPTELAIAELLAEGCTNAEIARRRNSSRRTVESHLGRVYQKLGIEGRVKLTVAAAEHFRGESRPPA